MKLDFDGRFDCVLMLDVAKGSTESFINSSSIILLRRWICSVERKLLPILRSVWSFLLLFNLGQEYTYETSFQFSITCLWQALISCLKTRLRLLNIFYHTVLSSFNLFVLVALYSRKFEKKKRDSIRWISFFNFPSISSFHIISSTSLQWTNEKKSPEEVSSKFLQCLQNHQPTNPFHSPILSKRLIHFFISNHSVRSQTNPSVLIRYRDFRALLPSLSAIFHF